MTECYSGAFSPDNTKITFENITHLSGSNFT